MLESGFRGSVANRCNFKLCEWDASYLSAFLKGPLGVGERFGLFAGRAAPSTGS